MTYFRTSIAAKKAESNANVGEHWVEQNLENTLAADPALLNTDLILLTNLHYGITFTLYALSSLSSCIPCGDIGETAVWVADCTRDFAGHTLGSTLLKLWTPKIIDYRMHKKTNIINNAKEQQLQLSIPQAPQVFLLYLTVNKERQITFLLMMIKSDADQKGTEETLTSCNLQHNIYLQ